MRGAITFVFDDGYEHVLRNVVPLLDSYGLHGVFAVPLENKVVGESEGLPVASWQQWLGIQYGGHEIAAHSVNHKNLTELDSAILELELAEPQEKLRADTIVYPGGAFDERVVSAATKYYKAGRTVKHGFETLPPKNLMRLVTINYTRNNFSVLKANLFALWACLTGKWLIETYHVVDDNEEDIVHAVKLSDLKKHLRFTRMLPIKNVTIREVTNNL